MLTRLPSEDPDSLPSLEVQSEGSGKVTSIAMHDASGFMWLGRNGLLVTWLHNPCVPELVLLSFFFGLFMYNVSSSSLREDNSIECLHFTLSMFF